MWTWTRLDALAPGAVDRFGQQPAAVAFAGKLRDEADEGELAFVRFAEIELEHADFAAALVDDRVKLDLRVLDDRGQMASSMIRRENHSHGAPIRRNRAR